LDEAQPERTARGVESQHWELKQTGENQYINIFRWDLALREQLSDLRAQLIAKGGRANLPQGWEGNYNTADISFFASSALQDLAGIERALADLEQHIDVDGVRSAAYEAMVKFLALQGDLLALEIIDNEPEIKTGMGSLGNFRESREKRSVKAAGTHRRLEALFLKRRPGSNKSDSALAVEVGEELGYSSRSQPISILGKYFVRSRGHRTT
jgi:hypothetical protein